MPLFKAVDLASPSPIGSTTANTGRFTTLTLASSANTTPFTASGYSLTGTNAQSFFDLSGTWNTTGTPTAFKLNVTDTASNSSSLLMDLQVGGQSRMYVRKDGSIFIPNYAGIFPILQMGINSSIEGAGLISAGLRFRITTGVSLQIDSGGVNTTGSYQFSASNATAAGDVVLTRDAADTFAQRRSTNAQTFRLYNTFTDASNYERGFFRWNTNVLEIGAEAAGTGTQRQLRLPLGTVTASTPLSVTQTWNNAGVTFTGIQANITDTASAFGSLLMDLQVGGTSFFRVRKNGDVIINGGFNCVQNSTLDGIISRQASMYGGSDSSGTWIFQNSNFNNFNMLKLGGTSSSFPSLKRSSSILQVRLADDSGYTTLDAQLRLQGTTPATAGDTGTAGDIRYDANYIYICTATNTWKRVAIATW